MLHTAIVILNYNGKDLLPLCLPSVVEAARIAHTPTRVILLDNQSTDQGLEYVKTHFPSVDIYHAPANKILCSYNEYLPKISEDIVILLNNDIRVDPGFVDPLVARFQNHRETFLAAPLVMNFSGDQVDSAKTVSKIRFGIFWSSGRYPGYEKEARTPSNTFSSGFGAMDRVKFLQLGGYDERYLPGIFEDADLCYRAAQAGYELFYEPSSVVYHMGQASFKKSFDRNKLERLAHRNNFLFMWKNFRGGSFWFMHLFWLPARLLIAFFRGKLSFVQGFLDALQLTWQRRP